MSERVKANKKSQAPNAAAKAACDALIVQGNKEFQAKLRDEEVS